MSVRKLTVGARLVSLCAAVFGCGCHKASVTTSGEFAGWPVAPDLGTVQVVPNRDSAVLIVPDTAGAKDYRVFSFGPEVKIVINPDGTETVNGATIFCAGREQHAAPVSQKPNKVMLKIEALGIAAKTRFAVEALDGECPFAGVVGAAARDFPLEADLVNLGYGKSFPMRTEDDVRAQYGSLIINGQGPQSLPNYPAPANPPKVLARAGVDVTPLGTGAAPLPFFDDFSDSTDQFKFVEYYPERVSPGKGFHLANAKWNLYVIDPDQGWWDDSAKKYYGVNIHHGQLTSYIAQQEAFGQNIFSPKQAVKLSDTQYLHVTFETAANSTDRRYWWFSVCGAAQAGATYDSTGNVKGRVQLTPFFYQKDGLSPYIEGWNCLQMFPFEGSYPTIGPTNARTEGSMRVLLNKGQDGTTDTRSSVRNIGPLQWDPTDSTPTCQTCGWYNTLDTSQALTGPLFDDMMYLAPRIKFDVYLRRDRVILYADGAQKLCNDFPNAKLTMAEGAIALGNVLYHSSAEHVEFARADWVRDGQRAILTIVPWVAQHNFDNVGYQENVSSPPAGFDARTCWVSKQVY